MIDLGASEVASLVLEPISGDRSHTTALMFALGKLEIDEDGSALFVEYVTWVDAPVSESRVVCGFQGFDHR